MYTSMNCKYKLVMFDMDGTLLKERTIFTLAEKKGFKQELLDILENETYNYVKTRKIASFLKGMLVSEFLDVIKSMPLSDYVVEVINELKNRGIKMSIVSNSYDLAIEDLRRRLGIDFGFGNHLIIRDDVITGEIEFHNKKPVPKKDCCRSYSVCKRDVLEYLCAKLSLSKNEVVTVGDGKIDVFMFQEAGLSAAYNAPRNVQEYADVSISDMRELLKYVI